jgi:hypothetical protein
MNNIGSGRIAAVVAALRGMCQAYWEAGTSPKDQPAAIQEALAALTGPDGKCTWPCPLCGATDPENAQLDDTRYSNPQPRCMDILHGLPQERSMCPMEFSATVMS